MKKLILLFGISLAPLMAQPNVSPFSPPPYGTLPGTCHQGDISTNTTSGVQYWCSATNVWSPILSGPASSVNGNVPQFGGTTGGVVTGGLPVATTGTSVHALVETGASGFVDPTLLPNYGSMVVLNDTTTGTTVGNLAKLTISGTVGRAINPLTTDTAIPVYIVINAGGGTSGSAVLATAGIATLNMDTGGAVTAGDFIVASTATAGLGHDAGPAFPSAGWVIGRAQTGAISGGSVAVVILSGDYAASGGGGGVSSLGLSVLGSAPGFTLTSSTTNPITSTGTVQLGMSTENANLFLAGPCTGSAATPTWRAICFQDTPGAVGTASGTGCPSACSGTSVSFDLSTGGIQTATLSGNITSSSFSNAVAGKRYAFIICQDSTGGRGFTWPTGFHAAQNIGSIASLCSKQEFDALTTSVLYGGAAILNQ